MDLLADLFDIFEGALSIVFDIVAFTFDAFFGVLFDAFAWFVDNVVEPGLRWLGIPGDSPLVPVVCIAIGFLLSFGLGSLVVYLFTVFS